MGKEKRFYITTPIYYVNDVPHLGHVYTTVAADVLARYHRLNGRKAFFLTGTDEHGQKAEQAAKEAGHTTQAHVDFHSDVFRQLWKKMNISNDDFIRTTEERHKSVVRKVLQTLYDKGEIYADDYEGWYCVPDERFWTEKDLVEGNCPDCGRKVDRITEKNYFFKMGKYQQWLIDHIKTHDDFIHPPSRRNEVLGFLAKKLGDLCISRPKARMPWGIDLPFDSEYVCYVWFDALLNYVSAPGYASDDQSFASIWPADVHLIGKDILTTHSVYWPTMLKAAGLDIPKKIFAHGWWTVEGQKMSKSIGNVVEPVKVAEVIGVDSFRYFLLREVPFGLDGDFSCDALISRVNVDLANNLGNLHSRTLKMLEKYRDSKIPESHGGTEIGELEKTAEDAYKDYANHVENLAFNKAFERMISLCDTVNKFIDGNEPWKLAKDDSKTQSLDDVLYGAAESLRILARMIIPVMPETANNMLEQLGLDTDRCGSAQWGGLQPGTHIKPGDALFPRIDDKKAKIIRSAMPAPKKEKEGAGGISIDDFKKIDLRSAVIVSAEAVKKSKRLLKLQVDLGYEKRQLVAGIAENYKPEDVIGKKVIIVANLKPAKIMGVESNGMLLAAEDNGKLVLAGFSEDVKGGLSIS